MTPGAAAHHAGHRIAVHDTLGSTNDAAAAAARAGDPGGLWVVARSQTGGRGRGGRTWVSPPGNLYASLLLREPCAPALAPQLGFVAGVALHAAMSLVTAATPGRLALKWPNDLLLDGAKVAGILVEGSSGGGQTFVVIGIGVNIASHPSDTPYPATDLAAAGLATAPDTLFGALSDALATGLARWQSGAGFADVRRAWLAAAGGVGQTVTVRRPDGERRGIFVDLDADGRLLLAEAGQTHAISAGDVFLTQAGPAPAARPATSGD